jgi:hypothetical protein
MQLNQGKPKQTTPERDVDRHSRAPAPRPATSASGPRPLLPEVPRLPQAARAPRQLEARARPTPHPFNRRPIRALPVPRAPAEVRPPYHRIDAGVSLRGEGTTRSPCPLAIKRPLCPPRASTSSAPTETAAPPLAPQQQARCCSSYHHHPTAPTLYLGSSIPPCVACCSDRAALSDVAMPAAAAARLHRVTSPAPPQLQLRSQSSPR